jgi:hypothetical protein
MKKVLMAVIAALISVAAFAQIGNIQTKAPKGKRIEVFPYTQNYVYVCENVYYLFVKSDNQYEDKKVCLRLGNKEEAIASLNNLLQTIANEGQTFDVQGYHCLVTSAGWPGIIFVNVGELEFAVGTYELFQGALKKLIKRVQES